MTVYDEEVQADASIIQVEAHPQVLCCAHLQTRSEHWVRYKARKSMVMHHSYSIGALETYDVKCTKIYVAISQKTFWLPMLDADIMYIIVCVMLYHLNKLCNVCLL